MESSFGRMFRKSKLASLDRSIKQVYATFPEAVARGDWGLKRSMPSKVALRLATLKEIDNKEQIIDFEAANQQFMTTMTWKENFLESRSPKYSGSGDVMHEIVNVYDRPSGMSQHIYGGPGAADKSANTRGKPQRNINMMTRAEWKDFLEEARARRAEWRYGIEAKEYAPEETMTFMNATDKFDSTNDGVHRSPTYHDYVPSGEELVVGGRVLNRVPGGFAVGIQGIVAYLPMQSQAIDYKLQYRDIRMFYVHSAKFDSQGQPVVIVNTKPRDNRGSMYVHASEKTSAFSYSKPDAAERSREDAQKRNLVKRLKNIVDKNRKLANKDDIGAKFHAAEKPNSINGALDLLGKFRN
ncbi:hypothetical protein LPJ72_000820 [Coemansia sp. Benny D160-2]|nr:hypothetical protein LPJ72_000820 [Coemansia sp. Benny D160-2]